MQAPIVTRIYFLAIFVSVTTIASEGCNIVNGVTDCLMIVITYGTALFTSMTTYRAVFHRLRSFRGPFWVGISKFWHVGKCIQSTFQNHLALDDLHNRYGEFVRTGKGTAFGGVLRN